MTSRVDLLNKYSPATSRELKMSDLRQIIEKAGEIRNCWAAVNNNRVLG